jgi:hypothetical protein
MLEESQAYVLCLMSYVLCLMSYVLCLMSYGHKLLIHEQLPLFINSYNSNSNGKFLESTSDTVTVNDLVLYNKCLSNAVSIDI